MGGLGVVEGELVRLRGELERLRAENIRLSRLLDLRGLDTAPAPEQLSAGGGPPGWVSMASPVADKLALYADRFRARTDVYAVRWDNARTGAAGWVPAVAGGWRKALGVLSSWFYKWRDRPPTARQDRHGQLVEAVSESFRASGFVYGSPRVWLGLFEAGWRKPPW